MFQRKGTDTLAFPKERTIGRLSWLAGKMREHSESVFLIEGLQPSWLSTRAQRAAYGTVAALGLGLIFALMFCLCFGLFPVGNGLQDALLMGLTITVGVGLGCWSESPLKNGVMSGSIGGLIVGQKDGLGAGLIGGLAFWLVCGSIIGVICRLAAGSLNHIALVETISWDWNHFGRG
jgi:eukaryotic-like serine/threonine-protein kinase